MKKPTQGIIYSVIFIIILAAVIVFAVYKSKQPGPYDDFAQCLTEEGVTYYGAFWCPNCQKQTAMFKKSKKFVNYVECSTPDRQGQKQACKDAVIEAYPTWEFADGERIEGVQSFDDLAEKTQCELPA
jgi:thiol-disulfide isomerase/thioredoxin